MKKKTKSLILLIALALIVVIIIASVVVYLESPTYFWFVLPKKEVVSVSIQYAKPNYPFMKRVNDVEYADRIAKEIELDKEAAKQFMKELNNTKFSRFNGSEDVKMPFLNIGYQYKIKYDDVVVYVGTGHLTYLYADGEQEYIRFEATYGLDDLERFFV